MSGHIGVDWASGCWVVVEHGPDPEVTTEPSILNVWDEHDDAAVILVDIPIGLAEEEKRDCDVEARDLLGPRSNTVFYPPTQAAIQQREYQNACKENRGFNGLGSQSWGLIPRIREVAVFLDQVDDARGTVYESHPEVCFAKLDKRDRALPSKSSTEGLSERLSVLTQFEAGTDRRAFGDAIEGFVTGRREDGEWHHRIQSGRLDDVVDAAALAVTAKLVADNEFSTFPTGSDLDDIPVIVHPGEL